MRRSPEVEQCFVTTNMTNYFDDLASNAEKATLATRTLSDALEKLQTMEDRRIDGASPPSR